MLSAVIPFRASNLSYFANVRLILNCAQAAKRSPGIKRIIVESNIMNGNISSTSCDYLSVDFSEIKTVFRI
mgnify:CR=1 FL=1